MRCASRPSIRTVHVILSRPERSEGRIEGDVDGATQGDMAHYSSVVELFLQYSYQNFIVKGRFRHDF